MTPNQAEVLRELDDVEWRAPMQFGGSNGSHHGITATRMVGLGWVERRYRGHEPGEPLRNAARGSCLYRITPKGSRALLNHLALMRAAEGRGES